MATVTLRKYMSWKAMPEVAEYLELLWKVRPKLSRTSIAELLCMHPQCLALDETYLRPNAFRVTSYVRKHKLGP